MLAQLQFFLFKCPKDNIAIHINHPTTLPELALTENPKCYIIQYFLMLKAENKLQVMFIASSSTSSKNSGLINNDL